jgi:hypothetical protein
VQKFGPNNIADFAELELSQANFSVLERSNLGHLLQEISLAYNLGDSNKARQTMQVGKLKTTQVDRQVRHPQGRADRREQAGLRRPRRSAASSACSAGWAARLQGRATSSVQTQESTGVWLIGMRYKIMDANTTEQVAQGYQELKMEVGAHFHQRIGVSRKAPSGGVGLDTMVQRLVQTAVYEIDAKYK